MPSFRELLTEAKKRIREVDTEHAEAEWLTKPVVVVLDVREPEEYEQGALPNAMHMPRGHLESNIDNRIADHKAFFKIDVVLPGCAAQESRAGFTASTADTVFP